MFLFLENWKTHIVQELGKPLLSLCLRIELSQEVHLLLEPTVFDVETDLFPLSYAQIVSVGGIRLPNIFAILIRRIWCPETMSSFSGMPHDCSATELTR